MEDIISYLLAAVVTVLTGDRVYQGVRARQHGNPNGFATKSDILRLEKKLDGLGEQFQRHLGYHEGLKER